MPTTRDSIDNVQGYILPDGITGDGSASTLSRSVLVTWRSNLEGKLHQVYVNGGFAGVTLVSEQRQLVVQLPSSFTSAVRLEIVGIEPEEAHVDFSTELDLPQSDNARVRLALLRSQDLPLGAGANICRDNGAVQVDYDTPLNPEPIPLWPCREDKAGFGMARFGAGDFGYESAAAIGFGKGCFGQGQFGLDADTVEWISPKLPLGRYIFGVAIVDGNGNESTPTETLPIAITPAAQPAARLEVETFDAGSNQLTLKIFDQI